MKNKIFAMVLAIVMLAAVMVPVLGANAEAGTVSFEVVAPSGAAPGGTITTKIVVKENAGFAAATLGLTFDKSQLTFVMPEENDEGGYDTLKMSGLELTYGDPTEGYQQMGLLGKSATKNVEKTGDLVEISFKVSDSVKIGDEIEIKLSTPYDTVNLDEEKLTSNTTGCTFKIACTDHKWGAATITKEATCTEKGAQCVKCTVCGAVKEGSEEEIAALGHDMKAGEVTAPTCTEKGYTTYNCSRCQATEKRDETAALGHDITDWKVTKEATVDAEGEKTGTCSRCKETKTIKIAKLIGKDGEIPTSTDDTKATLKDDATLPGETVAEIEKSDADLSKVKVEEGKEIADAFDIDLKVEVPEMPVEDIGLRNKVEFEIPVPKDVQDKFDDVAIVLVNEDGTVTAIEAEIKDGKATFTSDKEGTYAFVGTPKKGADKPTGDAMSVVLFAIAALAAIAGAVVVSKKRFA